MKRLVWLLLAVVGTALAQVQPTVLPGSTEVACNCCDRAHSCGMPDCAPPLPASAPVVATAPSANTLRLQVRRAGQPQSRQASSFLVSLIGPAVAPVSLPASVFTTRAASAPLFKVHCSFLL